MKDKKIFIIIFLYNFITIIVFFLDEEIDAVSKELQKYGIQLPPFQKIGGLLTNSIATDTAALHAAVIAINQALIDNVRSFYFIYKVILLYKVSCMISINLYFQDNDKVLYTLQSTEAQLNNIKPVYIKEYVEALLAAKIAKTETSLNRVCDCTLAQFYMFIFTFNTFY